MSDYLSQIVAPCRYVNSLAFSQPGEWPTRDGVHLTAGSLRLWDDKLIASIDQLAPDAAAPSRQCDRGGEFACRDGSDQAITTSTLVNVIELTNITIDENVV